MNKSKILGGTAALGLLAASGSAVMAEETEQTEPAVIEQNPEGTPSPEIPAAQYASAQEVQNDINQTVEDLSQKIDGIASDISVPEQDPAIDEELNNAAAELDEVNKEYADLENQKTDLENQQAESEKIAQDQFDQDLTAAKDAQASALEEEQKKQEELQAAETEKKTADEAVKNQQEKLDEEQKKLDELIKENDANSDGKIEDLQSAWLNAQKEANDLQTQADALRDELNSLTQKSDEANKQRDDLLAQKTKLENDIAVAAQEIDSLNETINQLQKTINELGVSKEDAQKAQPIIAEVSKLLEQTRTMSQGLNELYDKKEIVNNDLSKIVKEAAALEAHKEELTSEAELADKALSQAQKDLETLKKQAEEAQKALDLASQLEKDKAAELAGKQDELKKAEETINNLNEQLSHPSLEEAQKNLADLQAQYNQGSAGFFDYLAKQDNKDAQKAYDIITAKDGSLQDGRNSHIDYSSFTKLGEAKDATGLENMKYAVDRLGDVNSYRERENKEENTHLSPLKVNSTLMAISQWQTNARTKVLGHSGAYDVGENLAWGSQNPFEEWYVKEKEKAKAGATSGIGHYKAIVNPGFEAMGYSFAPVSFDTGILPFVFGQVFAGPGTQENNTIYNRYGLQHIEDELYTVEEYQKLFNEYYDGLMSALAKAQADIEYAQANPKRPSASELNMQLESAKKLHNDLSVSVNSLKTAADQAASDAQKKRSDLDLANQAVESSQNAAEQAQQAYNEVNDSLTRATENYLLISSEAAQLKEQSDLLEAEWSSKSAAFESLEASLSANCQQARTLLNLGGKGASTRQASLADYNPYDQILQTQYDRVMKAYSDFEAAKAQYDKLNNTLTEYQKQLAVVSPAFAAATKSSEETKSALDAKKAEADAVSLQLDKAVKALQQAQKAYDEALEKNKNLADQQNIVNEAASALKQAKAKAVEALESLNQAIAEQEKAHDQTMKSSENLDAAANEIAAAKAALEKSESVDGNYRELVDQVNLARAATAEFMLDYEVKAEDVKKRLADAEQRYEAALEAYRQWALAKEEALAAKALVAQVRENIKNGIFEKIDRPEYAEYNLLIDQINELENILASISASQEKVSNTVKADQETQTLTFKAQGTNAIKAGTAAGLSASQKTNSVNTAVDTHAKTAIGIFGLFSVIGLAGSGLFGKKRSKFSEETE